MLHEYLEVFAKVKYQIVDADGTGTCAGIKEALELLPEDKSFMLVWSDLILPDDFELPIEYEGLHEPEMNYVGISQTFPCRWSYIDGQFEEKSTYEDGVAGLFLFKNKNELSDVPKTGEFVRWMKETKKKFLKIGLAGTKEFGIINEFKKVNQERCRPFNKMIIKDDLVIKEGIDEQGKKLAIRECAWYEKAKNFGIAVLPKIYETNPLKMEKIHGKNVYEYQISYEEKKNVLIKLIGSLKSFIITKVCRLILLV